MTELAERFLEENTDGYGVQDYRAAADALVAADLVSDERAAYWCAEHDRLAPLRGPSTVPPSEAVEAAAVELLEELYANVRPRAGDDWDPAAYQCYQEALATLMGVGALTPQRTMPWVRRQTETMAPAGGWQRREPEPDPELAFSAGELRAVLLAEGDRLDGMRVMSLELYADCVLVRFHQVLPVEPDDSVARREYRSASFTLEDDVGTEYRAAPVPTPRGCEPRSTVDWPEVRGGWQPFVPGAPSEASAFRVTWRGLRFEVR